MSKRTKKIAFEVPHRISGFFEIVDKINGVKIKDPTRIGSRGAGFCVNAVGKTEILVQIIEERIEPSIEIYINGKNFNQKAETTHFIVNYIQKYINKPYNIRINHSFDLPVGCGYGASGSGALGTIFGLDYLFNLNLTYQDKGMIAHIAEVVNRTGLGTVCGQLNGGMGILKEPGFPCVYERIKVPQNLKIICGSFGVIHTKSILTDPTLNVKIIEAGKKALEKLIIDPNIKTFMEASIEFVKNTEMLDILELPKIKELMDDLNKLDIIGASMNQLGRSVYAICRKDKEKEILGIFECYKPEIKIFNTSIHEKSSIILKHNEDTIN
ncbi:MAG: pantoate kinase [Candidatus Hodarchaeota archaeon]